MSQNRGKEKDCVPKRFSTVDVSNCRRHGMQKINYYLVKSADAGTYFGHSA